MPIRRPTAPTAHAQCHNGTRVCIPGMIMSHVTSHRRHMWYRHVKPLTLSIYGNRLKEQLLKQTQYSTHWKQLIWQINSLLPRRLSSLIGICHYFESYKAGQNMANKAVSQHWLNTENVRENSIFLAQIETYIKWPQPSFAAIVCHVWRVIRAHDTGSTVTVTWRFVFNSYMMVRWHLIGTVIKNRPAPFQSWRPRARAT